MIALPSEIAPSNLLLMAELARSAPLGGDFVEVGVYRGGSAAVLAEIAKTRGCQLWLYDTFSGIPYASAEHGDLHGVGDFADADLDRLRRAIPTANIRVGVFPQTIDPEMRRLSFVHLDVDQHQSYCDAIAALLPLLLPGAVMVFDDYHALPSAKRAIDEMLGERVKADGPRAHYIHSEHSAHVA